jgi:catechol 2,3-dioxygenase-like lactoylglutathione lyase family enzyme
MKRFHVHIAVDQLETNIRFYSALFGCEPAVVKPDYAKWMLDDPRVNFAISQRGARVGLDHLGIQVETETALEEVNHRLDEAALPVAAQKGAACCYAQSDKYWTMDPQGIPWEAFHSLAEIPVFGGDSAVRLKSAASACCAPSKP